MSRAGTPGPAAYHFTALDMFNRLTTYHAGPLPDEERFGDFFVVIGAFGRFSVTAKTACAIARALDQRRPPKWLVFRDCAGSRVRVRRRDLRALCESTASQRAYDRRLERELDREQQADRESWSDD